MALPLSVLDQSPVSKGSTSADSLRRSIDLATLADTLNYSRYWVAEHHGTEMLACASPEALIGPIAAATSRIRVGSGGVMLPHYSPLKVAETFSMLSAIFPDRIDLGLGRAAGTDPLTAFALQRDRRQAQARRLSATARRAPRLPRQLAAAAAPVQPDSPPCLAVLTALRRGCSGRRRKAASGPPSSVCRTPSPISSTRPAGRSRGATARHLNRRPHAWHRR